MEKNYDDIMNLERPGLFGRARMSMEQRAAQFSPFAALSGYGDMLKETARHTSTKPSLDKDARDDLDATLAFLIEESREQEVMVEVERFLKDAHKDGGEIIQTRGFFLDVDPLERMLLLKDTEPIRLEDILTLKALRTE